MLNYLAPNSFHLAPLPHLFPPYPLSPPSLPLYSPLTLSPLHLFPFTPPLPSLPSISSPYSPLTLYQQPLHSSNQYLTSLYQHSITINKTILNTLINHYVPDEDCFCDKDLHTCSENDVQFFAIIIQTYFGCDY